MTLEAALSILTLAAVVAVVLAAHRVRATLVELTASVVRGHGDTLHALRELERYIDGKLDRLPLALRAEPREESALAPLVAALAEMSRRGSPPMEPARQERTEGPERPPYRPDRPPEAPLDVTAGRAPGAREPAEEIAPVPVFPPSESDTDHRRRGGDFAWS